MADPVKRTLEQLRAAGAPSFFERDPSVLKAAFKARFEQVSGRTLYPAQTEMFLIEVAAYVLSVLHEAAQTATLQNTAVFAENVHLDNRGAIASARKSEPIFGSTMRDSKC
jgi:hypothetical protein